MHPGERPVVCSSHEAAAAGQNLYGSQLALGVQKIRVCYARQICLA